jgi:hypothetical protein
MTTYLCWVCDLVGMIIGFLPSTPPQYTIGGLITATGDALPMIGTGLLSEIYTMVQGVLALFLVIKAFKIFQYFKIW